MMATADFFGTVLSDDPWSGLDPSIPIEDEQHYLADAELIGRLIDQVRPENILEVGSWKGHSANFMADRCRSLGLRTKIVCVDTFQGSAEHWAFPDQKPYLHIRNGRSTLFERFLGNTLKRGNIDLLFPFPIDSRNAAEVLAHYAYQADLIYLDGGHDYQTVRADMTSFWPLTAEGGVLFGDDYDWWTVRHAAHDVAEALGLRVAAAGGKWTLFRGEEPPLQEFRMLEPSMKWEKLA